MSDYHLPTLAVDLVERGRAGWMDQDRKAVIEMVNTLDNNEVRQLVHYLSLLAGTLAAQCADDKRRLIYQAYLEYTPQR